MKRPGMALVLEREAQVYRRMWRSNVFSSVVLPVLFLGAMGIGLGGFIDERERSLGGLDYLDFVAPGLLAGSGMQSAAAAGLWHVMMGKRWMRYFHGIVATPLGASDVYGGFVLWTTVRIVINASVFLVVAAVLGGVASPWGVLAVPIAALTAMSFVTGLAAFSASQDDDAVFPLILRLGITPLFLFSGTFFPVSQLPDAIEWMSWLSPLWHGVEVARDATTGRFDLGADLVHLAVLAGVVAVCWRLGVRSFSKALTA